MLYPVTDTADDKLSYYLAIGMIFVYIMFPIVMVYIFWKYSKKEDGFQDDNYKQKWSLLSAGLREDSWIALTFPFVFFGRRLYLIAMYIINHSEFELMTFAMVQVFLIIYYTFARPFSAPGANESEIMKESFLLLLCSFIPIYTDYVPDADLRSDFGFVMTSLFLIVVGINVLQVLYHQLDRLRVQVKYYLYNKMGSKCKNLVISYEIKKKYWRLNKAKTDAKDQDSISENQEVHDPSKNELSTHLESQEVSHTGLLNNMQTHSEQKLITKNDFLDEIYEENKLPCIDNEHFK